MDGDRGAAPVRVVLVEDEDLYRDLLRGSLEQEAGLAVVGSFGDAASTLAAAPALRPDVALLDVELRGGPDGIHVGLELRQRLPGLGIVVLSNHADPRFAAALSRGRVGGWSYLLKSTIRERTAIVRAIQGAARGEVVLDPQVVAARRPRDGSPLARLSPRQREILQLVAQGLTNAAIAARLVLAEKSIENQLTIIYEHLGIGGRDSAAHARVQAVLAYLRESRWQPGEPGGLGAVAESSQQGANPLTPGAQPSYAGDMAVEGPGTPGWERPAGRYGVFLVDDQPEFRRAARALLSSHPQLAVVAEAASGREALALLPTLAPDAVDAVLLDVQMPGLNGFETAQALHALAPQLRIIFTSTTDARAYAAAAARFGAAFLPKPRLSAEAVLELLAGTQRPGG